MADVVQVLLRLTSEEAIDLKSIQDHLAARQGVNRMVPRSLAAIAAIRSHAAELRRRARRREPGEEG